MNRLKTLARKAEWKVYNFLTDRSGSETTEKVGMVVVAVLIIAALAAFMPDAMKDIFKTILDSAKNALNGLFPTS